MRDLIDRQAAIDEFDGVKVNEDNCTEYDIGYNDGIDFAISKLSVLPAAERKGHWKGYNADNPDWLRTDGSPIFMSCSECNGTVLNNGSSHWNYCPNCGADMRGE